MPNLSYAILELNSTGLSNYDLDFSVQWFQLVTARCYAERGYEIAYRPSVHLSVRDVDV